MTVGPKVVRFALGCALAAVLALTYWFGILANWWGPLIRPSGIPASARYVFLWESAEWLDCSVDWERNVNVCRAWDDSGRLLADGDFRLEGENRAATQAELHPSTTGATAESGLANEIYLFGPHGIIQGRKLIRVVPSPTSRPTR